MSWSTKRKIIYLAIFIALVAVFLGFFLYSITRHTATCFDGIQDGNETGVDCGGSCVRLCSDQEQQPIVLWSRIFAIAPGVYSAAAYVQNLNATAQAFSVPYTFTFWSATGQLLGSRSGTTFIPAGQNFTVIESDISASQLTASSTLSVNTSVKVGQQLPARTDFQFGPILWEVAPTATRDFNALQISNLQTSFSTTSTPRVEADIANVSYTDLPRVDISAILYDASGNALGVSKTYISSLPQQVSKHIVFTWITPFATPPTRVELLPVVNEPQPTPN